MTEYEVIVLCNECGQTHTIKQIMLTDGPKDKVTVSSYYAGRELPPELVTINRNYINCPTKGSWFLEDNNDLVFLSPLKLSDANDFSTASEHARNDTAGDVSAAGLGDTGVRETGDILGASSTLTGAGGHMENESKFGTAQPPVKSTNSE